MDLGLRPRATYVMLLMLTYWGEAVTYTVSKLLYTLGL